MKKRFVAIILMLVLLLGYLPQTAEAAETKYFELENGIVIQEGTRYSFKNVSSGWHMNVRHAGKTNGTHVNLWPLDMSEPNTQCFTFDVVSAEEKIVMISPICAPNMYVDVRRSGKPLATAQKMCIWEPDGDPVKNLVIELLEDGSCYLTLSENRNYCIGAKSATAAKTEQTQLVVCKKNGAPEQRWFLCDENGSIIPNRGEQIYKSTIDLLDGMLESLEEMQTDDYSQKSNLSMFYQYYFVKLYEFTSLLRQSVETYYTYVTEYPERSTSSTWRAIDVLCDEIDEINVAMEKELDVFRVKLSGGDIFNRKVKALITWYEWLDDMGTILDKMEAYAGYGSGTAENNTGNTTGNTTNSTPATTDLRQAIAEVAYAELEQNGYIEYPGAVKYNYYWTKKAGKSSSAWCVDFVNWCANQAGVPMSVMPHEIDGSSYAETADGYSNYGRYYKGYSLAYVPDFKNYMIKYCGATYYSVDSAEVKNKTYVPQAGDIIIYRTEKKEDQHVGLVVGFDTAAGKVITIEGNTLDSSRGLSNCLAKKRRTYNLAYVGTDWYIQGYLKPNY